MKSVLLRIIGICLCFSGSAAPAEEKPVKKASNLWIIPPEFHDGPRPRINLPGMHVYPHVIPALGSVPPNDARETLAKLGAVLESGDRALFSRDREIPLLFVRADPEMIELIDAILAPMDGDMKPAGGITFTLTRRKAGGTAMILVRRTLLIGHGQRSKFQRHRAGKLLEVEEVEVSIPQPRTTLDINIAAEYHPGHAHLKFTGQALLRSGDEAGLVLCTCPDRQPGDRLELSVSGKVVHRFDRQPGDYISQLAESIDARIAAVEASPGKQSSDVYYVRGPNVFSDEIAKGRKVTVSLPSLGNQELVDVSANLKSRNVPLLKEDQAWYAPDQCWLYLRAGADALSAAAEQINLETGDHQAERQLEVQFDSWADATGTKPKRQFPARSILIRSGQRSSTSAGGKSGKSEEIELEASVDDIGNVAGLNVALVSFPMGRETWSFWGTAATTTNGSFPVPLVSGMSRDAGTRMKHLALSSQLRYGRVDEVILDPVRKGALVGELEATLEKIR
jgi:hypothetical protein